MKNTAFQITSKASVVRDVDLRHPRHCTTLCTIKFFSMESVNTQRVITNLLHTHSHLHVVTFLPCISLIFWGGGVGSVGIRFRSLIHKPLIDVFNCGGNCSWRRNPLSTQQQSVVTCKLCTDRPSPLGKLTQEFERNTERRKKGLSSVFDLIHLCQGAAEQSLMTTVYHSALTHLWGDYTLLRSKKDDV